jgi:hypothetical protein
MIVTVDVVSLTSLPSSFFGCIQLDGAQKGKVLTSIKAQIKELAKYQEEIAHHYAFCQEVLKRASDATQIDSLVLKCVLLIPLSSLTHG